MTTSSPVLSFLIPVYDHAEPIVPTLERLESFRLPCLLVDDGSAPECAEVLEACAVRYEWVDLLRREANGGKGAALKDGFRERAAKGFTHVFQIDADGQHGLDAVGPFLEVAHSHPDALILGRPAYDESVSRARYYGRFLSHFWVWINTLSLAIDDCMCGFRIYPLDPALEVVNSAQIGDRMEFDIEILVHLSWHGVAVENRDVAVGYPSDGISHFRMFGDNLAITKSHTRCFFGMLKRLPRLLKRKIQHRSMSRMQVSTDKSG
jgi:glycosyltransferase involved in cell wall biosynthesis